MINEDGNVVAQLKKAPEMARRLSCSRSLLYRMAKNGIIPVVRVGSLGVRFDEAAVIKALSR